MFANMLAFHQSITIVLPYMYRFVVDDDHSSRDQFVYKVFIHKMIKNIIKNRLYYCN